MITHHPARYQFDLLHLRVFINRAKIEVMHLFIEMATREYFLFEIVHRCEINGKGEETTRILGGRFLRAFSKKKKKGRTAHFLHANDDNCFPTAPLCDIIFSTLYIFCLNEQRANRKIIERCRLLWVQGFRWFRSLSLSRWILITRVHSIGNDCHFKFYCCIQRCVNFFSVQRESFLYRKLLIWLFQFYVINYYLSK